MSDDQQKSKIPVDEPVPEDTIENREKKAAEDRKLGKDELIERQKAVEKKVASPAEDAQKGELSEEDKALKENLEMLLQRITEPGNSIELRQTAIEAMSKEIRTSTSSMTAIPKPLKFLRPHYETLVDFYDKSAPIVLKPYIADVLSVLSMIAQKENERLCLHYHTLGSRQEMGYWGHEHVRHLTTELNATLNDRYAAQGDNADVDDLFQLVKEIIPFFMKHNAEIDAIDLLAEFESLNLLLPFITEDNYSRIVPYVLKLAEYSPDTREYLLNCAHDLARRAKQLPDALRIAIKLGDHERVKQTMVEAEDPVLRKQLGFILAVQRYATSDYEDDSDLKDIIGNVHLSKHYQLLAQDLDVQEAKTPEDVYKSNLAEGGPAIRRPRQNGSQTKVDSAKQNLASTFVNAFLNVGYNKDLLLLPDGSDWLYKNSEAYRMSAAASMGMLVLWELENGFSTIDKYTYSGQTPIKAGAIMATGMLSCGVTSEMDAALALLTEHVESPQVETRIAALFGLGLAYVGTAREDVLELLTPIVVDGSQPMEVVVIAALSMGFVFVGTAREDISSTLLDIFIAERSDTDLKDSTARTLCIALGLLFLGKQDEAEGVILALDALLHPIKQFVQITVRACAYFGSGSVLEIQKLLAIAGEHFDEENKDKDAKETERDKPEAKAEARAGPITGSQVGAQVAAPPKEKSKDKDKDDEGPSFHPAMHQAAAVLGIAFITMGEEIGSQMALRSYDNLLQYGDITVRRAVPIALSVLCVSNPRLNVIDTLSKLTHDSDLELSQNAVFALGLIGAGTNNSRIATLLRSLSVYYSKEPNHLFLVRVAQGLLHLGKGLVTINPFNSDGFLMIPAAAAALAAFAHTALDLRHSILGKRHYLLYSIVPAIRPRMLMTVDEELRPVQVKVRVGTAVDIVGAAGRPKSIQGFQTHTTPILLSAGERAELHTDEYIPLSNVLEDVVIVKKNPNALKENE